MRIEEEKAKAQAMIDKENYDMEEMSRKAARKGSVPPSTGEKKVSVTPGTLPQINLKELKNMNSSERHRERSADRKARANRRKTARKSLAKLRSPSISGGSDRGYGSTGSRGSQYNSESEGYDDDSDKDTGRKTGRSGGGASSSRSKRSAREDVNVTMISTSRSTKSRPTSGQRPTSAKTALNSARPKSGVVVLFNHKDEEKDNTVSNVSTSQALSDDLTAMDWNNFFINDQAKDATVDKNELQESKLSNPSIKQRIKSGNKKSKPVEVIFEHGYFGSDDDDESTVMLSNTNSKSGMTLTRKKESKDCKLSVRDRSHFTYKNESDAGGRKKGNRPKTNDMVTMMAVDDGDANEGANLMAVKIVNKTWTGSATSKR